jgi:hypothetical protein
MIFTNSECNLWRNNKNINPKTKRTIKETSVIYKQLLKTCENKTDIYKIVNDFCISNKLKSDLKINKKDKEIYDKINELCKIKKRNLSPLLSSSSVISSHKSPIIKKQKSILKSNLILTSKSILININDINKKNKILLNYFSKFNKNNCLELTDKSNQYLLSKDILLYRQIGSKSVFGVVYKSKIINDKFKDIPKFVSKIQLLTKEFKQELSIFEKLSKYAIKNNICHFPILYASSICNNIIRNNNYPELLAKAKNNYKNYSIILYELANGDLQSFIYKSELTSKIWKNIYEQIFMSILLFHSLNLFHGDCHNGNFLYTKIKSGGCFHYKINGINYYIENIGYKWMIWDYGNTRKLSELTKITFFNDYRFINLFFRKFDKVMNESKEFKNNDFYSEKKAGYLDEKTIVPSDIKKLQDYLWQHLGGLNDKYLINLIFNQNKTEYEWFKYFIDNNILFSKVPIGTIISTTIINIK